MSNGSRVFRRISLGVTTCIVSSLLFCQAFPAHAGYSEAEFRQIETTNEAKIREIRDQEIRQLRLTLGRHFPANRQAELYFRLAEIYMEAYHMEYVLEGRVHDKRLEQGQNESRIDHSRSRPYLLSGIKACNEILRFRIPFSKMDQVYYFLAFNYGELGEQKESAKYYQLLTAQFPSSPFAGEAYRELAEAEYDSNQFRKAIGHFEQALKSASADKLPLIHHRLAWSYYRTRQYDRAIGQMKLAVESTRSAREKFISIREEALRDMALFMTETGRVEEALSYFHSEVGDQNFYPKLLEKLGHQYERNVEPVKATQVYESLLKTHPGSEGAFRVAVKLVDLDLRRSRFNEALQRLKTVQIVQISEAGEKSGLEEDTRTAARNLRAMIRRTATEHHEKFRKKNDRSALSVAESYYGAYLQYFLSKDDPRQETPEIRMYLAEVKRDLGKASEASALYRQVVDSRDKRYAKEAGALWTSSLADAIKKTSPGKNDSKSQEPSEMEKEFVVASDSLAEALGDSFEGREAALRAARVLAGYSSTQKDAEKRLREIIRRSPKTPQAVTSARLRLQLLVDRGAGSGAIKDLLQEFRENKELLEADQEFEKGKLRGAIVEQENRARVAQISQYEREKDFVAAAKGYEEYARSSSQADSAEKAYESALNNYSRAGEFFEVDRVSVEWLKRFPKSAKALEALRTTATHLLIAGDFEASATIFERVGNMADDGDSLETAARINEANKNPAGAERNRIAYLQKITKGARRGTVALALARAYEEAQREGDAARYYRLCMTSAPELEAECGVRLAELFQRARNDDDAQAMLQKVASLSGKAAASPYVGYARFQMALRMEKQAKFQPLQLPDAKLKAAMDQRLEFLAPLSRAYMSAVDAGGPWAIAALDRLAQWATSFADEVDRIEAPVNADPNAVIKLRNTLATISAPLRKKAAETWSEAYSKSVQAELYSPAIPELADRLADLHVTQPGRAQGVRGRFRLSGVPADGGREGLSDSLKKFRERLQKNPKDSAAWTDYGNLLWGSGKPGLARIAYDRAILLNQQNAGAFNNRAVVLLSQSAAEDPVVSAEAASLWQTAIRIEPFFLTAKMNLGMLLNYYRLFGKAKNLWEQVLVKAESLGPNLPEAHDGLGVALQGLGDSKNAEIQFKRATEAGAAKSRFASVFHEAARQAISLAGGGSEGPRRCLDELADLDSGSLNGFEKEAVERLKRTCTKWKTGK